MHLYFVMIRFANLFRFKNLVQQYQSMYPSLTVDVEDQLKKLKVDTDESDVSECYCFQH